MAGHPPPAHQPRDPTTAIVLAGGGAAGAYQVGVLKALTEGRSPTTGHRPLECGIYTGTSVGAYNAAVMTTCGCAGARHAAANLETIWRRRIASSDETCGNGVYRLRLGILSRLDPACYVGHPLRPFLELMRDSIFLTRSGLRELGSVFERPGPLEQRMIEALDLSVLFDVTPFHRLVRETIDGEALAASDVQLRVAATDWTRGALWIFNQREIAELGTVAPLVASASLPGVFPPVAIDDRFYVDGGVVLNAPMAPAILAGAVDLHIIDVDPVFRAASRAELQSSGEALYRTTTINWTSNLAFYLELGRGWNNLVASGASDASLRAIASAMLSVPMAQLPYEQHLDLRPLTAHLYRPAQYAGGFAEWLDFSSQNVERLIDWGYHDTITHDCARAGCVYPVTDGALDAQVRAQR